MNMFVGRSALLPLIAYAVLLAAAPSACNEPKVFDGAADGGSLPTGSGGEASNASSGGNSSTGGAATLGGSSGEGGGAGLAGGSGVGGAGGALNQGGAGVCVPSLEDCFNSKDDDCDGKADCADSDCQAKTTCVPGEGTMAYVTSAACPGGIVWASQKKVNLGLKAPLSCPGCSCDVANVSCKPTIYFYSISTSECQTDTGLVGGTLAALKPLQFLSEPPQPLDCQETVGGVQYGARLAKMELVAECKAKGAAQPLPPEWETTSSMCEFGAGGSGCVTGVCVPATTGGKWVHIPQNGACPSALGVRQTWYTGVKDERSCGQCGCAVAGGTCAGVSVQFSNDGGCYGQYSERLSVQFPQNCRGLGYSPGAALVGSPPEPTCSASSSAAGAATPSGPVVTCAP